MDLKFIIDEEYDKNITLEMIKCISGSSGSTAKSFRVTDESLSKLELAYKTELSSLESSKVSYQKSWDEIIHRFSDYVENTTEHKWFYPEYTCLVSVIHRGMSNWGNAPEIVRGWKEDPIGMRRITAHELILSHYFEIYKRHHSEEGLKNGQVWALAEIAGFALTSLTPEAKQFWPDNTEYYTNHNYPHIVELQNELKTEFINRTNFGGYMKKGFELVRAYPQMNPLNN